MLNVRVWVCSECKTEHKRDENSSKHIGERGMLTLYPTSWEKPYTRAEASASIEACSIEQANREHEQPNISSVDGRIYSVESDIIFIVNSTWIRINSTFHECLYLN